MRNKLVVTSLLVLLSAVQAEAVIKTRYVSTSGSDSNSCLQSESISTPKRNLIGINGAIACMGTSDILYIRSGTYNEMISTDVAAVPSGTAANEALIAGYPGDPHWSAILRTTGQFGIQLNGTFGQVSYLTFQNLVIDGVNATNTSTSGDGIKLRSRTDHIRVIDSEIKNSKGQGIVVSNTPTAEALSVFNKFQKLSVHDNGDSQQYDHGIYILTADNTVEDCDIYQNATYGVQLYHGSSTTLPARNIIRRNDIHNNARLANIPQAGVGLRGGIMVAGPSNQVYRNLVRGNLEGIELGFGTSNSNLIYNNTIYGNTSYGMHVRSGMTGNSILNNLIYQNGSDNFTDSGSSNAKTANLCSASQAACQLTTGSSPFVDAANSRFDLVAGSAAIDAGTAISGFLYNGPTPGTGALDIGAFETITFASAKILDDASDNKMEITFTNNVAAPLLPVINCAGFTARKNTVNNPVLSCTRSAANVMTLTLTNSYTSSDTADFSYITSSGTVTDSALIGLTKTQRLNAITLQSADVSTLGGGVTVPILTQGTFQFRSPGGPEALPDYVYPLNTNVTIPPNSCIALRGQIANTVANINAAGYAPFAQRNGSGGYAAIANGPCTSTGICFVTGTAIALPELIPGPTTDQLAGSGTFVAGGVQTSNAQVPTVTLLVGQRTDLVAVLCNGSGNSAGDTFDIRWYRAGVPLDFYTQTPRITIGGYLAVGGKE